MIYYRVASQKRQSSEWEWKSTTLNSLESVFRLCRLYSAVPMEHLRVFIASSAAYMDVLLVRENLGLPSNSVTVSQLMHDRQCVTAPDVRRFELELGWQEEAAESVLTLASNQESAADSQPEAEQEEEQAPDAPAAIEHDHEPEAGDHDTPYSFTFPEFTPHALAWLRLRARVLAGELVS
jgi:hypothetical protein